MSEAKVPPAKYVMPTAQLGPCLWFHAKEEPPMAAFITETSDRSVYVSVLAPDNRGLLVKSGVRHVSDPELFRMPEHKDGCWDYTDEQKQAATSNRLLEVLAIAVDKLEFSGAELLKALGQP